MYQATTPTFICTVPDTVDLTQANKVVWTFVQGLYVLTKTDEDLTVELQAKLLRRTCIRSRVYSSSMYHIWANTRS